MFQLTLLQALSQLIGEALVSTGPQGTQPAGPDGEPAADPAPGRRALKEYKAAQDALKNDNLADYQQHIQKLVADLQQLSGST